MHARAVVVLRERTLDDFAGCIALLKDVHATDEYPAVWPRDPAAWLTPGRLLNAWVALSGSTIVGHVTLGPIDEKADPNFTLASGRPAAELAEIKRLFVRHEVRGSGIAARLLAEAAHFAQTRGRYPVLETVAASQANVRFYERNGWRRMGSSIATWSMPNGEKPLMYQFELSSSGSPSAPPSET
jgi:GNAT superfamily N-acetyltransferase